MMSAARSSAPRVAGEVGAGAAAQWMSGAARFGLCSIRRTSAFQRWSAENDRAPRAKSRRCLWSVDDALERSMSLIALALAFVVLSTGPLATADVARGNAYPPSHRGTEMDQVNPPAVRPQEVSRRTLRLT